MLTWYCKLDIFLLNWICNKGKVNTLKFNNSYLASLVQDLQVRKIKKSFKIKTMEQSSQRALIWKSKFIEKELYWETAKTLFLSEKCWLTFWDRRKVLPRKRRGRAWTKSSCLCRTTRGPPRRGDEFPKSFSLFRFVLIHSSINNWETKILRRN